MTAAETWVQLYPTDQHPLRISPPGQAPARSWPKASLGRIQTPALDDSDVTVTEVNGGALIRRWERVR